MRLATSCLTRSVAVARLSTVCVGVSAVRVCQLAARDVAACATMHTAQAFQVACVLAALSLALV